MAESGDGTDQPSEDGGDSHSDPPRTRRGGQDGKPYKGRTLSLDETLKLLSEADRRAIMSHLVELDDDVTTVDGLVEAIADAKPDADCRESIRTNVYHVHLPTFTDAGVVEHDERSGQVRYFPDGRLEDWFEVISTEESEP